MEAKEAKDFHGNVINVGDKVIAVFGTHLRDSVIEKINVLNPKYGLAHINVKGIKRPIQSNNCIKIEAIEWRENMAACMVSILDTLKLFDTGALYMKMKHYLR